MMDLWQIWIADWRDNHGVDTIRWKTTVGIGDSLYGFNIAYMRAFVNQKPTNLEFHYHFPKNYYYHYEDPESVDARAKYALDRYMWKDIVNVTHVYNSTDFQLYNKKYYGVKRVKESDLYRFWSFDPRIDTTSINNKIVLWRPTFNGEQQINGPGKFILLGHEWQRLIDRLKDFGFDVIEIDYRTPISEVFYHIRTCECIISYEGMWHYVAKNFFKPHIVISNAAITKWHTPHALRLKNFFIDSDLKKIHYYIRSAEEKAYNYKQLFLKFINGW